MEDNVFNGLPLLLRGAARWQLLESAGRATDWWLPEKRRSAGLAAASMW